MKVTPYADATAQPPVAVLVANADRSVRVLTDWGEDRTCDDPHDAWDWLTTRPRVQRPRSATGKSRGWRNGPAPLVFSTSRSLKDLADTCDCRHWLVRVGADGRATKLRHDDSGVVIRAAGIRGDLADAAAAIFDVVGFANAAGVKVRSSLASMGYNLWRSTLAAPVGFWCPPGPTDPRDGAFFGGRKGTVVGETHASDNALYDLVGAYPWAMADAPIPLRWDQVTPPAPERLLAHPELDALHYVRLWVDGDAWTWNPLPFRLPQRDRSRRHKVTYGWGHMEGWWSGWDLAALDDTEYRVLGVDATWEPRASTDAFASADWMAMVAGARALSGMRGTLAKQAVNSVWGIFAARGDSRECRWATPHGDNLGDGTWSASHTLPAPRHSHGYGVAISTTARVRRRLWEALATQHGIISADTDGFIGPTNLAPEPYGGALGQWREKRTFGELHLRHPECYRWREAEGDRWWYCGHHDEKSFTEQPTSRRPMGVGDITAPYNLRKAHLAGEASS